MYWLYWEYLGFSVIFQLKSPNHHGPKFDLGNFFLESFFIGPGHVLYLEESPETHFRDSEDSKT